ncbi:tumor protein D52 isoform X2 [Notamacropus eugenii]|uniref:tumor protein D52 isoform X2 n=1 Tax=Notamacropus eugenii TaxID=9315 RepID=UPI003B67C59B
MKVLSSTPHSYSPPPPPSEPLPHLVNSAFTSCEFHSLSPFTEPPCWCKFSSPHTWTIAVAFWLVSLPQVSPHFNLLSCQFIFLKCLLKADQVPEEGEDAAATINTTETLSEEEQEELRKELAKVEEEIQTLSQVLAAKEKHLAEIKRKLGINSLQELRQNIAKGWQDVTATSAYKKTSETLSQAGQKASAAFSSVGSVITKKLEDVKNSPTFKSFEEKVENLKSKVGGNKPPGGDFGEVLNSTANASATESLTEQTQENQ